MADTSILDRKLTKAFGHIDVNHNGLVDHDDVVALAGRMLDNFSEAPTGAKGQKVLNGFETWWQALLTQLDLDGDRKIDPQEWRQGMVGAFVESNGGFARDFQPLATAVLQLADTNDDGTIQAAEWRSLQRAFGTSTQDADLGFGRMDTDRNGSLDVSEMVEAVRQYYTSANENDLGNWLYGRV